MFVHSEPAGTDYEIRIKDRLVDTCAFGGLSVQLAWAIDAQRPNGLTGWVCFGWAIERWIMLQTYYEFATNTY